MKYITIYSIQRDYKNKKRIINIYSRTYTIGHKKKGQVLSVPI